MRHAAAVVAAYALLFTWVFARPLVEGAYLAGTDLYDNHLPMFLSPITIWSSYELSGLPAFADPQNATFYPLTLIFAHVLPSFTAYVASAYVLAASFTYAYIYNRTRSVLAAAVSGLAYGLSEAMIERLDHLAIVHALAWLPLIALAIDRLQSGRQWRWVAVGAVGVASCFLAGHPQPAIYIMSVCGLYTLVGGLLTGARLRYYLAAFTLFAAGGLLASVSLLPLVELSGEAVRQTINFGQFVSHSNTPAQMLSLLVPAIEHGGREAPTYVGLAVVVFALVAIRDLGRHWPVAFWWAVAVVALLAGVGDATPVASVLYDVPVFDRFRVIARLLVLAAFALAALSGFGVAAVARGRASRRAVLIAAVLVAAGLLATMSAIDRWPQQFALDAAAAASDFPGGGLAPQLLLGLATAAICIAFGWKPSARPLGAAVLVVLAVDLVHALPYDVRLSGIQVPVVPSSAVQPSVHAEELRDWLAPLHQRVMAPAGVTVDPVVPAAFARLWRIPTTGAYGTILTPRYAALAKMGTTGAVEPQVLADDNTALDLLAVRYILLNGDELGASDRFEREGVEWASETLDLPVGPEECGQRYPRTSTYALPPDVSVARVLLVSALRCSEDVMQDTEVATVAVIDGEGRRHEVPLRAGIEVAEASLANEDLRRRAKHEPADVFESAPDRFDYLTRIELPEPVSGARLEFRLHGTPGWLQLRRVTVLDEAGAAVPVGRTDLLVSNRSRWRPVRTVRTSRITDRGADRDEPGEQEVVIVENRRARPRAWLTHEVVPLSERDMLTAVHYSHLPGGRRFEPAETALVDIGAMDAAMYPAGADAVRTQTVDDGAIQVRVQTSAGGFLVLSESYYPGWRVRIGDAVVPVLRTNLSLQGVVVPPGDHLITFEFAPASFRAGAAISAITLIALTGLCIAALRRGRARRRPAPAPSAYSGNELH